jgi:L-ascorbate metabolism protein UlaG (beta-lactamase superfamily)
MPEDGYKCPICLRTAEDLHRRGGNAGAWVVDHDHKTNTFRGHLCHSCNRAIGMFQDSKEVLQRAIDYLDKLV